MIALLFPVDRGYYEYEVELTKEDIEYFIRTNLDFPPYESMSNEEWEEYLKENVPTFIEELTELYQEEFNNNYVD